MIVAGQKYPDVFSWGKAEQFHTIETEGEQFWLFQAVKVTTIQGFTIKGQIAYITEDTVHINSTNSSVKIINLTDIKRISY